MLLIEPLADKQNNAQKIFEEFADDTDDKKEYLSLNKFALLANKKNLFSAASQNAFIGKPITQDFSTERQYLENCKDDIIPLFRQRLNNAGIPEIQSTKIIEEFLRRFLSTDYSSKCTVYTLTKYSIMDNI